MFVDAAAVTLLFLFSSSPHQKKSKGKKGEKSQKTSRRDVRGEFIPTVCSPHVVHQLSGRLEILWTA